MVSVIVLNRRGAKIFGIFSIFAPWCWASWCILERYINTQCIINNMKSNLCTKPFKLWVLPVNWNHKKQTKITLNWKPFWDYKMSCTTNVEHIFILVDHSNDEKLFHRVGQPNCGSKTWFHTHVEHGFRIKSGTTTMLSNIFQML